MKNFILLIFALIVVNKASAQVNTDTLMLSKVTINKDPRIDMLGKIQYDFAKISSRLTKGYRLFLLKTNDRDYAMKVRSYLLQNFPGEKVIMSYQSPFIKMKFGNFIDKEEAEKCKNQILKSGVITGEIYIVPDTIELKPGQEINNED